MFYFLKWPSDSLSKFIGSLAGEGVFMGAANGIVMGAAEGIIMGAAEGIIMGAAEGLAMGAIGGVLFGLFGALIVGIFGCLDGSKKNFLEARERAKICGKILAYMLISSEYLRKFQINLIGFSLGNHVIKHCIKELDKIKKIKK